MHFHNIPRDYLSDHRYPFRPGESPLMLSEDVAHHLLTSLFSTEQMPRENLLDKNGSMIDLFSSQKEPPIQTSGIGHNSACIDDHFYASEAQFGYRMGFLRTPYPFTPREQNMGSRISSGSNFGSPLSGMSYCTDERRSFSAEYPSSISSYSCYSPTGSAGMSYSNDSKSPQFAAGRSVYGQYELSKHSRPCFTNQEHLDMQSPRPPAGMFQAPIGFSTASRHQNDQVLVDLRDQGISYKEIKSRLQCTEAESTLRGRYRALKKPKSQRLRKPVWKEADIQALVNSVRSSFSVPKDCQDPKSGGSKPQMSARWKHISEEIFRIGGNYLFGPGTCKKKYKDLVEAGMVPSIERLEQRRVGGSSVQSKTNIDGSCARPRRARKLAHRGHAKDDPDFQSS
ncbi:hypothetical protein DFH27DRAFT_537760 [Peziza echinospora]|nr:hypothetical protein DFH27DRAFT_537760 [Peziza echinospora]